MSRDCRTGAGPSRRLLILFLRHLVFLPLSTHLLVPLPLNRTGTSASLKKNAIHNRPYRGGQSSLPTLPIQFPSSTQPQSRTPSPYAARQSPSLRKTKISYSQATWLALSDLSEHANSLRSHMDSLLKQTSQDYPTQKILRDVR